jgi:hypothetical protein
MAGVNEAHNNSKNLSGSLMIMHKLPKWWKLVDTLS